MHITSSQPLLFRVPWRWMNRNRRNRPEQERVPWRWRNTFFGTGTRNNNGCFLHPKINCPSRVFWTANANDRKSGVILRALEECYQKSKGLAMLPYILKELHCPEHDLLLAVSWMVSVAVVSWKVKGVPVSDSSNLLMVLLGERAKKAAWGFPSESISWIIAS